MEHTITITAFDDDADNFRKFNFKLGIFYNDISAQSFKYFGLSYYCANKFYVSSTFGGNSLSIDANILLKPKIKKKIISQDLKSTGRTIYIAKIPIAKKIYPAPHIGASLGHLAGNSEPFFYSQYFSLFPFCCIT